MKKRVLGVLPPPPFGVILTLNLKNNIFIRISDPKKA